MEKNNRDIFTIDGISSDKLLLNESEMSNILADMNKQLEVIDECWMNVNHSINTILNQKLLKSRSDDSLRGIIKKSKIQSSAAKKLSFNLKDKFDEDVNNNSIQLLDKRISALEEKIAHMVEE